ncbi:imidazole glycerol phosphate synthase subunit HisF [Lacticaseibacillus casei]|uniref:imidazole glycerol phosphate synthase subunit HisF n=1 Tax=Lacticaseibacillus casei TaxID=1582 RepID=UPI00110918B5|nr:imidazole glycerol phosphate synthase subunit HisF [Lacticaseibacillus casei]TLQ52123.1 imidazole glycerol phosphate synthase subunit HisF [Lacticaseibacillus casei]
MLTKRIIPCLDVDQGRVKKGVHFIQLKDVGDPIAIAKAYEAQGADELVFLDITATTDARQTMTQTVAAVAAQVFMPLTVGGGIRSVADMHDLLRAVADKIALNSAAVKQPELITAGAETFGSQAVVVAIDTRWQPERQRYQVTINGGRTPVDLDAIQWAKQAVVAGAGELLVTSMDADGTQEGLDLALYRQLSAAVTVPIVACGGAGSAEDFVDLFKETAVSAGLAASIFHFGQLTIPEVKKVLKQAKVAVR